jgi:hypothetical protein
MSAIASVSKRGDEYVMQLVTDKGVLVTATSRYNQKEWAEAEALEHFPEATEVNGMKRSERIEIPAPNGKCPKEKLFKKDVFDDLEDDNHAPS